MEGKQMKVSKLVGLRFKEKPADCGALIQYDGWSVSKDYPLRF